MDARVYVARQFAEWLGASPRDEHGRRIAQMLECAEVVREAIISATRAFKHRERGRSTYGDAMLNSYRWYFVDIAMNVLGVRADSAGRARARTDNERVRRLSARQRKIVDVAVERAWSAVMSADDFATAQMMGATSRLLAAGTAFAFDREIEEDSPDDYLVRYAVGASMIGTGKQKSAPQVAVLALSIIGYSNADICELLDGDPAEVRRFVKPLRAA
jgi:hypothetical protein